MKHLNKIPTLYKQSLITILLLLAAVLRLVSLDTLPPGLYIDEVSIGNNAYSILVQGVDEHGKAYPLWFEAFGEYKMPIMIYLVSFMMALVGKSELAVRLPSALIGILSVYIFYRILELVVSKVKEKSFRYLPLLGAGLLAITPWHIHFSRGGFEATVALGIFLGSVYCFLNSLQKKSFTYFIYAVVLLGLTMYAYNTYRITAVLMFAFYVVYAFRASIFPLRKLLWSGFSFLIVILPMILFSLSPEGAERFRQTSALAGFAKLPLGEQIIIIPMDFLRNYLRYFSLEFLFAVGDQNGRHQLPGFGLLYRMWLPFFLWGLVILIRRKKDMLFFLTVFLLLIAPLPGSLTIPSPHALRSLLEVIPVLIIVSLGMTSFWIYLAHFARGRVLVGMILIAVLLFEFAYYGHLGTKHYPRINALDWGGGYKQILKKAASYQGYSLIAIDTNMGNIEPYIAFYTPNLQYQMVPPGWVKPTTLHEKKVLYIRPDYHEEKKEGLVGSVQLDDVNKYTFAEFYEL